MDKTILCAVIVMKSTSMDRYTNKKYSVDKRTGELLAKKGNRNKQFRLTQDIPIFVVRKGERSNKLISQIKTVVPQLLVTLGGE